MVLDERNLSFNVLEEPVSSAEAAADTIIALSSGAGRAGVAVIRLSGPGSGEALIQLAGALPPPRRASLRRLRDRRGETLDRGLVLWLPAPESFTGEDMAELHVHGGRAVVEAILGTLVSLRGARLAEPGEFTRRAFENGRLDLTEVEGFADLIDAETEAQRRQAVAQAGGALSRLYGRWRLELLEAQARLEALLDFSDESDVPRISDAGAELDVAALRDDIQAHLDDGRRGEILRDGYRVVIAGPPNAGKSSLLNALARREAAIVSDEPGTTRDAIEVRLDLAGFPVVVTDTAGLREETDAVEAEGVRRALSRAQDADTILWLSDSTAPFTPPPETLTLHDDLVVIRSKSDRSRKPAMPGSLPLSVKRDRGISELIELLAARAKDAAEAGGPPPLTRLRHRRELEAARDALVRFLWEADAPLEIKAEELRLAAFHLGRITGKIDVEDVLGAIFSSFCIGK